MKNNRIERVNSLLQQVLSDVIQSEVKNPHITTFVSVTKVDTSADLHHAKVYVSLVASPQEKAKVIEALQSAAGFIAVHASKQVRLRYFPNLTFKLDKTIEEQMRIQEVLQDIEKERLSRPEHHEE